MAFVPSVSFSVTPAWSVAASIAALAKSAAALVASLAFAFSDWLNLSFASISWSLVALAWSIASEALDLIGFSWSELANSCLFTNKVCKIVWYSVVLFVSCCNSWSTVANASSYCLCDSGVLKFLSFSSLSFNFVYIFCKRLFATPPVSCVTWKSRPEIGRAKWRYIDWYPIPKCWLSAELILTVYSVTPAGISISLLVNLPGLPFGLNCVWDIFSSSFSLVNSSPLVVILSATTLLPSEAPCTVIFGSFVTSFCGSNVTS